MTISVSQIPYTDFVAPNEAVRYELLDPHVTWHLDPTRRGMTGGLGRVMLYAGWASHDENVRVLFDRPCNPRESSHDSTPSPVMVTGRKR